MASRRVVAPAKHLFNGFRAYNDSLRCTRPSLFRSMATEVPQPNATLSQAYADAHLNSSAMEPILMDKVDVQSASKGPLSVSANLPYQPPPNPFLVSTQSILYEFPSLEPLSLVHYPSTHLQLPLRRDILHRAVIFEGDAARRGTASTKWRDEVHGSGRKVRPQKGTGRARLGDKKSPMLRGGGVAFGPKPRDFSTELPQRVYDLAVRTALSYRYSKGELLVIRGRIELEQEEEVHSSQYLREMLHWNQMGRAHGRTLFITEERRENLFQALEGRHMDREAHAKEWTDVDVKNLLETPRLMIERAALDELLMEHETDIAPKQKLLAWRESKAGSFKL